MIERLRLPDPFERRVLVVAGCCWLGVAGGAKFGPAGAVVGVLLLAGVWHRRRAGLVVATACLAAGALSGWFAAERAASTTAAPVDEGPVTLEGRARNDPLERSGRWHFVLNPTARVRAGVRAGWHGPALEIVARERPHVRAGDTVEVAGRLSARPGVLRGDPVAGVVRAHLVSARAAASDPLFAVGNGLRGRVLDGLEDRASRPEAALLAGFLIGEVADLPERDLVALRRSGLTHYVAVSGSNVALFLAAWWLVMAPLALDSRVRAVAGLAGLAVFVVVTRWEPSVLRAATMAGIVLIGKAASIPVSGWTALGAAVAAAILVSGDLAHSVGFQLSVAATAGVLAGATVFRGRRPRVVWSLLGATMSAQLAVLPLLLIHFGSVPLMAPIANLLAAPLVTAATALGGIGVVVGFDLLTVAGLGAAKLVLEVARHASAWPQLGPGAAGALMVMGLAGLRPGLRPAVVLGSVAALLVFVTQAPGDVGVRPSLTVLDVGQGDALLVRDRSGGVMLVDGGRDPTVLETALRRHGISRIDLLVVTHGDADHAGALTALADRLVVGRLWHSPQPDGGELMSELIATLVSRGVPSEPVVAGSSSSLGSVRIDVIGPLRRYAADNDGSVVLLVDGGSTDALLAGDIEAVAQRELPPLQPDVVVVPHHGAATSDPGWLAGLGASLALISVGENSYGHPDPAVIAALETSGTLVRTTLEEGDITVPLDG